MKRNELMEHLYYNRALGKCENDCGRDATEMHEWVTRGDVMGWPKPQRKRIFVAWNCLMVCRYCHPKLQSDRESGYELILSLGYDAEFIAEWIEDLPWKDGPPPQLRQFLDTASITKKGLEALDD